MRERGRNYVCLSDTLVFTETVNHALERKVDC